MDRLSLCLTQLTLNRYLIVEFDSFDLDSASFYLDILLLEHMGPEAHVYSSKSTNGGKGLQNSKINSYFTP